MTEETPLNRRAEKLYAALESLGPGWHGRTAIARAVGQRNMSTFDSACMDYLVSTGHVEAEQHEIEGPIKRRWEYRVKGSDTEG